MNDFRRSFYQHAVLAQPAIYRTVVYSSIAHHVSYTDPFLMQSNRINQNNHTVPMQKIAAALALVLLVHTAICYLVQQFPTQALTESKAVPVVVEIVQPEPKREPAKVIEPEVIKPKIPPIATTAKVPTLVEQVKNQPTMPVPGKTTTAEIDQKQTLATTQAAITPVIATTNSPNVQPVATAPTSSTAATSPAIQSNVPITEAKGYAGYLSNPAPDYPEIALDRGWEGSVMLRVNVSAAGLPLSVSIKSGSGRKVLDDAAIRTVKRWRFSPAMRGSTAIEGWVDVPIDYRLPR